MEKILITGAAGFIGSHLTELLVEKGFDEVIEPHPFLNKEFNQQNPFVSEIIKEGIEVYQC